MKIETKEIYIAEDGKQFFTLAECEEYEQLQADRKKLIEAAKTIQEHCKNSFCDNCLLYSANHECEPHNWIFEKEV